jgi:hypothetical protein
MAKYTGNILITPKLMKEHEVTITIYIHVKNHWRVSLALFLFRLGGFIGGVKIKTQDDLNG